MKSVFSDKIQTQCIFTDKGVAFCSPKSVVYFPYGCLDSIHISLLGILQAKSRAQVCCFTAQRSDRPAIKELVHKAEAARKSSSGGDCIVLDLNQFQLNSEASPEEQLHHCKALFVQGLMTKEQYDVVKLLIG